MDVEVTREIRQKAPDGTVKVVHIGALAENVQENENRMFVTKKEKTALEEIVNTIKTIPSASGALIYNGGQQRPQWRDYDPNQLEISGQTSGTNAGNYTATFTPKPGKKWSDGTVASKNVVWSIERAKIEVPSQKGSLTYTGLSQQPSWNGYDAGKMSLSGATTGINAASYQASFTPAANYKWSDGSVTAKMVSWTIGRAILSSIPAQSGSLTYTGAEQRPAWNGYDEKKYSIGGQASGTNAGAYTATFTPTSNYQWSDGTTNGRNAQWSIKRASISKVPSQNGVLSYTGGTQSPKWNDYNQTQLTIGGIQSAVEEGTYTATFTPTSNYQWSDGSVTAKNVTWRIDGKAISIVPSPKSTLTYNGSSQSMTWNNYSSSQLIIGGTQSATDAGNYTATFTPQKGYVWSDGTRNAKEVQWTIHKMVVNVPSQRGTLTFNKSTQYPSWNNYNMSQLVIGGSQSGYNAGTYEATFTPKPNYKFADGAESKRVSWKINKANGIITPTPSSFTFSKIDEEQTLQFTVTGTRSVTVNSNSHSVVQIPNGVSLVGGSKYSCILKAVGKGQTSVVIHVAGDMNYNATSLSISVTVNAVVVDPILANNSPEQIQEAARSGQAANLWSVGDTVPIYINGKAGTAHINGTYYAFIIGFNHNSNIEGNNTIHFQFGKDAGGKELALVDSKYGALTQKGEGAFAMTYSYEKIGGWSSSTMRTGRCHDFYEALPVEWKNVITGHTKYTDNIGNSAGSSTESNVTITNDKIFLLSEYELTNQTNFSNSFEAQYQKQYAFYANGNSKIKYKHSDTETKCSYWLRSLSVHENLHFKDNWCYADTEGNVYESRATTSFGFAPAFVVA